MDFGGFDSSIMLFVRGGILMSIGDFPEDLSQAMLARCNVSREIGRSCSPIPSLDEDARRLEIRNGRNSPRVCPKLCNYVYDY